MALRHTASRLAFAALLTLAAFARTPARGQASDVPICDQARQEPRDRARLLEAARRQFTNGVALKPTEVKRQLRRTSCQLQLPEPNTGKLPARDICIAARHSHVRVGWSYLCPKCSKWHLNLAGGYAVTANGAVGTCFHVVEPGHDVRDGCLVAVGEDGTLLPVVEVLAASRERDACIVRVKADDLTPLPLNTQVYPGDAAYCYSDPMEHRDYFTAGIVNRFYRRSDSTSSSRVPAPTRINVSTDWAPGSSGSAVLDECANAMGHVTSISAIPDAQPSPAGDSHTAKPAAIIFHEAVSARDVLSLIKR